MSRKRPTLNPAAALLLALCAPAFATTITVTDPAGAPVATAMVRERPADGPNLDTSDEGYPAPGVTHVVAPEITGFSDAAGVVGLQTAGRGQGHGESSAASAGTTGAPAARDCRKHRY